VNNLFIVIALSILLASCGYNYTDGKVISYRYIPAMQGKIIDCHYHHPNELFSFKIPKMLVGADLEEMLFLKMIRLL
jgi:hypothetical protein